MKYKEFIAWCNERACDGQWGSEAMFCIDIMQIINKEKFWNREKLWSKINLENRISEKILIRKAKGLSE